MHWCYSQHGMCVCWSIWRLRKLHPDFHNASFSTTTSLRLLRTATSCRQCSTLSESVIVNPFLNCTRCCTNSTFHFLRWAVSEKKKSMMKKLNLEFWCCKFLFCGFEAVQIYLWVHHDIVTLLHLSCTSHTTQSAASTPPLPLPLARPNRAARSAQQSATRARTKS
jgi:hypothetical protein